LRKKGKERGCAEKLRTAFSWEKGEEKRSLIYPRVHTFGNRKNDLQFPALTEDKEKRKKREVASREILKNKGEERRREATPFNFSTQKRVQKKKKKGQDSNC